jgi:hypothetical protein
MGEVNSPEADEKGIISSTVPTIITARKLNEMTAAGECCLFFVLIDGI